MWLSGELMPEPVVRSICRRIALWLIVKIFPFSAYVVLFIITKLVSSIIMPTNIAVLCALYSLFLLWRDLKRIGRIKRREFAWCEGVTAGILGRFSKGNTLVDVGFDTVKAYGHPAGMFYVLTGRPVYVVALNILESSFFRGGFVCDPLAFKKKDQ